MKKLLTLFILSIFIISCSAEDSCEPTPKLTTSEATEITDVSATVTGTLQSQHYSRSKIYGFSCEICKRLNINPPTLLGS